MAGVPVAIHPSPFINPGRAGNGRAQRNTLMNITFEGGARRVTGSQFLLETGSVRLLVDCGLYQGRDDRDEINRRELPYEAASLDFVILTHAHLDHCGLVPRLYSEGFRGSIYCTGASSDLVSLILADSASIQQEDARWERKRWVRRGKEGPEPPGPLYTVPEAQAAVRLIVPCEYGKTYTLPGHVQVRFLDAGHILGSATVELWFQEGGRSRRAVFSGDLGRRGRPIIRDPQIPEPADIAVMESTYGSRLHDPWDQTLQTFLEKVQTTLQHGGHVVIPAFAVGRTQDVLYCLGDPVRHHQLPPAPIFVDSPMALQATEVFRQHTEIFDEETQAALRQGESPFDFPGLHYLRTMRDSLPLNDMEEPFVVISASGMCAGGRIRHHLHHHLEHPEDVLLFVGYQAEGTLGRDIVDGLKEVPLFGTVHPVRCEVVYLEGFSAHADQAGLVHWAEQVAAKADRLFLVHGEEESLDTLQEKLSPTLGDRITAPGQGERYEV
jgi:metallo-beta-lactamase family protein